MGVLVTEDRAVLIWFAFRTFVKDLQAILLRIIGDVVDMIVPSIAVNVYYGTKHIMNGSVIKPSITLDPPSISISGESHELFTLVMTDPDAPSPSDPSMREWIHWIVTNIPGGSNPLQGTEVLPYMPPSPRLGIHRYIFILFRQQGPIVEVEQPAARVRFSTRAFARELNLGVPVGTVYFNCQKEPLKRKRNSFVDTSSAGWRAT